MRRCLAVALSVCCLAASAEPRLTELSARVVVEDAPREFGGLSALIVQEDGGRAQVLTDRGRLFDVGLGRDGDGGLESVFVLSAKYLYLYDPEARVDTEGLARAPDGGVFVSTENPYAVMHYAPDQNWPTPTAPLPALDFRNENRSLEALARDPQGRLVTIPEMPPEGEADFPVFRLEDGTWTQVGRIEREGAFLVVGADHGPDGHLYVLERAVSPLGFRSRIRRVTLAPDATRSEVIFQSHVGQFDNLEGLSLWRDAAGQTRITMVSDDNFLAVQRTEFVEFILRD